MQQLISITTDGQGASVVSARDLYAFLEVKARFNDWFKRRVIKYGFQQDVDYVEVEGVLLKSEYNPGGRPETDYALTLDMAKQLSMVENNEQGQQARRYFIDCERKATAPAPPAITPAATEQMMLGLMQQQTQLIAGQQVMLEQLRADVVQIRQTGHRPPSRVKRLPAPAGLPPHLSPPVPVRQQITRKVGEYCHRFGADFNEAYRYLYKRMFEVYGVNVYSLRVGSEKSLDALERYGHLDRLLSLVLAELSYIDE